MKELTASIIGLPTNSRGFVYYNRWFKLSTELLSEVLESDEPAKCLYEVAGEDVKEMYQFLDKCEQSGEIVPKLMISLEDE